MTDKIRQHQQDISKQRIFRALSLVESPFAIPSNYVADENVLALSCDPAQTKSVSSTRPIKIGCDSYRFPVPQGWEYGVSERDICLTSSTISAWIIIFPHEHASIGELDKYIQPEASNGDMQLKRQGHIELINDTTIAVNLNGAIAGIPVRARLIGTLSPYGGGAYILTITKFDLFNIDEFLQQVTATADIIAGQMEYLPIDFPELKRHLSGLYANQKGNRFILLNDGTFGRRFKGKYTGFTDTPYGERVKAWGMASWSAIWGKWTVRGNDLNGTITAKYPDGSRETLAYHILNKSDGQPDTIKLNGKIYNKTGAGTSAEPSMLTSDE